MLFQNGSVRGTVLFAFGLIKIFGFAQPRDRKTAILHAWLNYEQQSCRSLIERRNAYKSETIHFT
jgi:hypothetical protein